MDQTKAITLLGGILAEIESEDERARTESFASLRAVDAKVREAKLILREAGATTLLTEMERDIDFSANSRRVRLEALANHCRMALRFFKSGTIETAKQVFKGPRLTEITNIMPELEVVIQGRWIEAQRCQNTGAYLAAVIMMGSILEALLLARCSLSPSEAYQSNAAPKDRNGKPVAFTEWSLNSLIDVAVTKGWLKTDRGGFSHALRQSRNVVHPYEHARTRADYDEATCKVCWQVLNASVDDLLASLI